MTLFFAGIFVGIVILLAAVAGTILALDDVPEYDSHYDEDVLKPRQSYHCSVCRKEYQSKPHGIDQDTGECFCSDECIRIRDEFNTAIKTNTNQ